jgi:hypothetical protein
LILKKIITAQNLLFLFVIALIFVNLLSALSFVTRIDAANTPRFALYPSTNETSQTSGMNYSVTIKPTQVFDYNARIVIAFEDAGDGLWCRTPGSLIITGVVNPPSDLPASDWGAEQPLPGSLTGECTQGIGDGSFDKIVITGISGLGSGVSYGFRISEGSARLGTSMLDGEHVNSYKIDDYRRTDCEDFELSLHDSGNGNGVTVVVFVTDPDDDPNSNGYCMDRGGEEEEEEKETEEGEEEEEEEEEEEKEDDPIIIIDDSPPRVTGGDPEPEAVGILDRAISFALDHFNITGPALLTLNAVFTTTLGIGALGASLFDIPIILTRGLFSFLSLIGLRKKPIPYGYVYNSITKEPLSHALVRIFSEKGKLVYSDVTDAFGVFGAKLDQGKYRMNVTKYGFNFPSLVVKSVADYPIDNVYRGGEISLSKESDLYYAIPVDPAGSDGDITRKLIWKERGKWGLKIVNLVSLTFGFTISVLAFSYERNLFNSIILALYIPIVIGTIYSWMYKPTWGRTVDEGDENVTGVVLGLRNLDDDSLTSKRVTDDDAKYRFVVPVGNYEVEAIDNKYELVSGKTRFTIDELDKSKMNVISPDLKVRAKFD